MTIAKVCILTSVHTVFDVRIFHKQAKSIVLAGYRVTLIAPHDKNEVVDGIQIRSLKLKKNRIIRMFMTVWALSRLAIKEKADIYHFHDPELIPIGLFLKLIGRKVIYDSHEDVPSQILTKPWIPKPLQKPVAFIFGQFEKFSAKRFDAVITATPFIRGLFMSFGCKSVVDVCNFPKLEEFSISKEGPSDHSRRVCYVGGISKIRGIGQMVEAIGLTDFRLSLAGNFESKGLHESVRKVKGWEQIEELGFLSREETADLMASSIAGIVVFQPAPNHINSQPNKLFEYMAAGLPILASNFSLWSAIVEENHCGLCVDPEDPRAIARGIEYFISHPEEAKEMGRNGRRMVEEKYNWESESKKLLELYEGLIRSNG